MVIRTGATSIGLAAIATLASASFSVAHAQALIRFDIPAQDLGTSLRLVGSISGRQVIISTGAVEGKRAPSLHGNFSADEAIAKLIAGTNVTVRFTPEAALIGSKTAEVTSNGSQNNQEITVTGTRISGAKIASPVISVGQSEFREQGDGSLADVVRNIPQNFGGGQNPGVGQNVPEGNGLNLGSASTINLRGLGNDATLTLLDGHRLAYDVANQAIDISTIPLLAVDRVEVVPDGASALYGSDAVAGVANIILRRDYSGLLTSARLGAATDGGGFQQQYGALTGARWATGGFMVAYEFERDAAIDAADRDYTKSRSPGLTLYPSLQHHDVVANVHQMLGSNVEFQLDGMFNRRLSDTSYAFTTAGDPDTDGERQHFATTSYAVAPTIKVTLDNWKAQLTGFYGEDRSHYQLLEHDGGVPTSETRGCYCNSAYTVEVNASGTLFQLPAGDVKAAFGSGYHSNRLHSVRTVGAVGDLDVSQGDAYGFGELDVPVFGPSQQVGGIHSIDLTAALRYERYPGIDGVTTPKLGVIYAPLDGLDLKGSWGKSFKAPTLYQRYTAGIAALFPAAALGGAGMPAGSTALFLLGGNPNLKPERATSWSVTADAHPAAVPGLNVELSYFNVHYRDRVVAPITNRTSALSSPIYADLVTDDPSAATTQQAIQGLTFLNATGAPFDPASVVAIANSLNLNVAAQTISGLDFAGSYKIDARRLGTFTLQGDWSYLHSTQRLSSGQPLVALAGELFNPPHWHARGGVVWVRNGTSFSVFANYLGAVTDDRTLLAIGGRSMTTFDATLDYAAEAAAGPMKGIDLSISVMNAFNKAPPGIITEEPYDAPYDSTNYSPIGRFISLTIRKKW